MQIRFSNKPAKNSFLIYPLFEKAPVKDPALRALLQKLKRAKEFSSKAGQMFSLFGQVKSLPTYTLLLGLGDIKKFKASDAMAAFGGAMKQASDRRRRTISVMLPEELHDHAQLIAEACVLAGYQPSAPYKSGKTLERIQKGRVETLEFAGLGKNAPAEESAKKGMLIAGVTNDVRDWVNAPPNFANAEFFDKQAKEIAKETGAKLTIFYNKQLAKLNMGAILGVNRGSHEDARLVILDYIPKGADPKEPPIVLVGKGILFDSGGYNLKPRGSIEDMQLDKAGAATVLAVIKLLPKLGIKRRVVSIAPFTENLIGKDALKPSEILTTYSGKTIEITNTDAEGRLVLADAVAYAVDIYKPKYLIDLATLTGACMIALGDRYAGLFANDRELAKKLRAAGSSVDELLWPLPLHKDFAEKIKGYYADLRNADLGSERYAGASKGAAFIQAFVGKTKWAHVDIAGPAFTSDPKKYEHKGATGFGVRMLARFLETL